ncbi:prephenate dehydratase [Geosporobacter ferrireducens]|uniref:Prephenate dehydratase n=1 Tax=Geosporobacter ferrireducens TaxID=1424294 RepID=A0A1D8GHW6_9FIRM|nr:prephenate dehydratase [Geosporobacter ferrireducens]AOT70488.1 hypothetical protein Gferi_13420 [Geosporobacter ferrireducens]MTI57163.1 prephenate dehydratase [Geosporobacter ferrireducens]
MEIAYLGPEGSYSHGAALAYISGATAIPMQSFSEVFEAVETGKIKMGILPIENSTEGAVTMVMDGLLHTKRAQIIGELVFEIRHHLLSTGKNVEDIQCVLSHPQAIEQCREFFRKNYPSIRLLASESSSQACITAKNKGITYGAIANKVAGERYGLNILSDQIQDNLMNQTRFIVIGRKETSATGRDKTSIAFSFHDDHPGSLYEVLREFAERDINLTRIESRPAKAELGKYVFYIDFHGHQKEVMIQEVLEKIQNITRWVKVLGSYPLSAEEGLQQRTRLGVV